MKEASLRAPNGSSFLNDKTLNFEPGVRQKRNQSKENSKLPKLIEDANPVTDKYVGNAQENYFNSLR
jgi:hypothetical protein